MGIESPRIAADVTKPRVQIYDQPISTVSGPPVTTPDYEGQIVFERPLEGEKKYYMYVAVDISGTLTWKEAGTGGYIDGYTGKPWNPLYHVKGS